jgi:hypothetical protein
MTTTRATDVSLTQQDAISAGETSALDPRDVAARVSRDHRVICTLLDEIGRASTAALERRRPGLDALAAAVWKLYVFFEEHLSMEESEIAPLIRAHAQFGELRADAMLVDHELQRRALLELVDETECDTQDIERLVARAAALAASFRSDILAEEAALRELGTLPRGS